MVQGESGAGTPNSSSSRAPGRAELGPQFPAPAELQCEQDWDSQLQSHQNSRESSHRGAGQPAWLCASGHTYPSDQPQSPGQGAPSGEHGTGPSAPRAPPVPPPSSGCWDWAAPAWPKRRCFPASNRTAEPGDRAGTGERYPRPSPRARLQPWTGTPVLPARSRLAGGEQQGAVGQAGGTVPTQARLGRLQGAPHSWNPAPSRPSPRTPRTHTAGRGAGGAAGGSGLGLGAAAA